MNKQANVTTNTLKDGVKTPVGTLFAVENSNSNNFPGISIYIQEHKEEPADLLAKVEHYDGKLRIISFPKVYNYDAEPDVHNFDFPNSEDDQLWQGAEYND